jgi:hypothetical protein
VRLKPAAGRRQLNPFSLAFLDIMSCGLGAVILVFLLIKHADETVPRTQGVIVADIEIERATAEGLRDRKSTLEATLADRARARAEIDAEIDQARAATAEAERALADISAEIADVRADTPAVPDDAANAVLNIEAEGNRNYLIGLKVEGQRIAILLDTSASMLAERIVDILRLRNSSPATQRTAPKWAWGRNVTEWLAARVPSRSDVRVMTFSTDTVDHSAGRRWMSARATPELSAAVASAINTAPLGGTNLEQALDAVAALSPAPDTVYLITDGLPTLHGDIGTFDLDNITSCFRSNRNTVTPKCRGEFFTRAMKKFYRRAPDMKVNVVLLPIEGDPEAAMAYWLLANQNGGTLLSPREGWP